MISTLTIPSDDGVRRLGGDTAVVVSVPCHLDVSTGSPSCSPRVLHQVVVAASLRSVSDSKDGVVHSAGRTSSGVVDSGSVASEGSWRSIDGDGHWSHSCKGVGQVVLASWLGIMEAVDSGNDLSFVELAVSLSGGVGVSGLRLITTGITEVSPRGLVPSSLTSVVTVPSGAIDDLLF